MKRWLVAVMIAANQLANALLGGKPDESISSRLGAARAHGSRFARIACATLERIDFHDPQRADHCTVAIAEHARRTAVAAVRAALEGR